MGYDDEKAINDYIAEAGQLAGRSVVQGQINHIINSSARLFQLKKTIETVYLGDPGMSKSV